MAEDLTPIRIEDEILAEGFVQVPVVVVFDPELSTGAKTTYGALLWYSWKFGGAPAQAVMAEHLGGGRRTIQRHLSDLEQAGYIETRMLGLGRPNEYVIKSLRDRQFPGAPKMAHLVRHKRRTQDASFGAPHRVVDSDLTTQTLSHKGNGEALAHAFFLAIGEAKPSKARREKAIKTVNGLRAEGFSEEAIQEAIRLAGERGARGPDLLPHLVGEAHSNVEARSRAEAEAGRRQALAGAARERREAEFRAELEAVDKLPKAKRKRLEAEARAALPEDLSDGMAAAIIPGWIAARVREG